MQVRMGWGMVRQSVGELTDAAKGNEEDVADVRYLALRVPGVRECSAVRVRRLGPYSAGDVRIALADAGASLDEALAIKDKVRSELLHHMPQLREVVIELSSPTPHHHGRHSATEEKTAQQASDVEQTTPSGDSHR
jgi:divalent metal cation (Fe/Co/Zn/Cd) transporter